MSHLSITGSLQSVLGVTDFALSGDLIGEIQLYRFISDYHTYKHSRGNKSTLARNDHVVKVITLYHIDQEADSDLS